MDEKFNHKEHKYTFDAGGGVGYAKGKLSALEEFLDFLEEMRDNEKSLTN